MDSGSVENAADLKIVATLEDTATSVKHRMHLHWTAPSSQRILSTWEGLQHKFGKYMLWIAESRFLRPSGVAVAEVYKVMCEMEDAQISDVQKDSLKSFFEEF